jgi:hypothetical protein
MYGALDVAEAVALGGLASLARADHQPFIPRRGIKYNIPLDSRTPSYSCGAKNSWAQILYTWDFEYWKNYLDDLARWRYNLVSLWTLNAPLVVMVKIPEFPDIALDDVMMAPVDLQSGHSIGHNLFPDEVRNNLRTIKKMTIEEKIAFWQKVMQYGHDRGIKWYIFLKNIHTYGIDGKYGITEDMNNTTKQYIRNGIRELVLTYPLLDGIGITAGEHMPGDTDEKEQWCWESYGLGILDAKKVQPNRHIEFIHRSQHAGASAIWNHFSAYPDSFFFEDKYSDAHMFSTTRPDMSWDYYESLPSGKRTFQCVRNDDFYMTRWGDPEFAREYLINMNAPRIKNAGYAIGSSGYVWGIDIMSREPETPPQSTLAKHWYNYMLFGRLGYDPQIPEETFRGMLRVRFPEAAGSELYDSWASVSKVMPMVTRFHWYHNDYMWFPEMCLGNDGFHTVQDFIDGKVQSGANMYAIPEYVSRLNNNQNMNRTTPPEIAASLRKFGEDGLKGVANLNPGQNKELRLTIGDIRALANLGLYYSEKILGATYHALGKKDSAVHHLKLAAGYWRNYASLLAAQYKPWHARRLSNTIDPKAFWPDVMNDISLAGGDAEIPSAQPTPGGVLQEAEQGPSSPAVP